VDTKLDDISNQLATMLQVNQAHFAKIIDLMKQKLSAAVTISEQLIHISYSYRHAVGALTMKLY